MEPDKLLQIGVDFFHVHPVMAVAVLAAAGSLVYLKPKFVFKLAAAAAVLGVIGYVVTSIFDLTSTGVKNTEKFLDDPKPTMNSPE